jgi:hypothetical protein
MAPCCLIPGILICLGVSTLEAPNEQDMFSSCNLIISIKHLCFTQCVLSGYYSFSLFYNRLVDRPPFFFEFSAPVLSPSYPHTCTGPALYALGGRRVLPGLTCVLFCVNRLRASLSDHRFG